MHIPTENGLRAVLALGVGAFAFASLIPADPSRDVTVPAESVAVKPAGAE
ncbi:hypothetical protein [Streptomyces sp. SID12501]|uniref:Uncharacterized protein n=1 Tax=Streptomyces sp. SID12501 TaxID=2706042 RepID=A0A6B3BLY8_9ACTN|nr:hypothetical protein [Streptomyces sp. SID12501]NEC85499.1 hypothetical protein [Streptomyces sp. SID12501]